MSITTNVLSKLVKSYGPNMGRVVHAVAEETGLAASKVAKKLLGRGGPLKSEFDFENLFHHATPGSTPSRAVAARGGDPLAALKRGKPMGEHLAPFEHIKPSSGGALGSGTYVSRDPLWSFRMGTRPSVVESSVDYSPADPASIIPYILKKGWKDRMVPSNIFRDETSSTEGIVRSYLNKHHSPKTLAEKMERSLGGSDFRRVIPKAADRKIIKKEVDDFMLAAERDRSMTFDYNQSAMQRIIEKSIREKFIKQGKIGVSKERGPMPSGLSRWGKDWPEEHVIFPGLEKEHVRHPFARFQNRIGGTFASLLPLISMLRGKREE